MQCTGDPVQGEDMPPRYEARPATQWHYTYATPMVIFGPAASESPPQVPNGRKGRTSMEVSPAASQAGKAGPVAADLRYKSHFFT